MKEQESVLGKPVRSLLQTTLNTRDLGGYRTSNNCPTRSNLLLRSDAPPDLNERDIDYLLQKKITTMIDLRCTEEVMKVPSPLVNIHGFEYRNLPIEDGSGVPESMAEVPFSYMRIAEAKNMPQVFRTIANASNGVLFHCSAGKDRTGVVSAILLLFAGVGTKDIVDNYMMTKECNREKFEFIHKNYPELDMNIVTPHEEYMLRFVEMFTEKYRNVDEYFRQSGLTVEEIHRIKEKLIES